MKFEQILPCEQLRPYIRHFVISESDDANTYKILPSAGLVLGFQYRGSLAYFEGDQENKLATVGITGIQDRFKLFKSSPNIGSILVFFNEIGASYFFKDPINELFNQSISLDYLIAKSEIEELEEMLSSANNDENRIALVEAFLLSHLKAKNSDHLVSQAIIEIQKAKGNIKIKALSEMLSTSQSPLEKRFRKIVGTTPKKFASIVRINNVINDLNKAKPFSIICYDLNYFDQAHLIHDFKNFTGETPDKFEK